MTSKAALAKALLDGKVINIKNCFETIGLSNAPREVSRMIEQPFGVVVSRTRMEGKSRYGTPICWFNYRLNKTDQNKDGIEKMRKYVDDQSKGGKHFIVSKPHELFSDNKFSTQSLFK